MKKRFLIFLALALMIPSVADAAVILRSGDSVSLEANQVAEGDLYAAGVAVSISGNVEGDLIAAGATVTLNGEVTEDAVLAGDSIQVHGAVGDDVRFAGREVIIADRVGGDVIIFGDVLRILSTATIEGDLVYFGRVLEMAGEVKGTIKGNAETIRIDGTVGGDVSVTALEPLTLGERANIEGGVTYTSYEELIRAQGSVVVGEVEQRDPVSAGGAALETSVLPLFGLLFTSLVYLLLFRSQVERLIAHITPTFGYQGLIGLAVLVATPVAALLLIATLIGMPIGLLILFAYITLLFASWSLAGIFVGALLSRLITKEYTVSWLWVIVGTFVFFLLGLVPVVGWVLALFALLVMLGGIATLGYRMLK